MITITKHIEIDSMHFLPEHAGKCQRKHGHTYAIDIEIEGEIIQNGSSQGMVMDYGHITNIVKAYDHRNLNDIFRKDFLPTTAENFARLLVQEFTEVAEKERNIFYIKVTVSETRSSSATKEVWLK